ncbi:hypothetical protein RCCS2_06159 [Roseobacter sp. CCS2]|nr:hypothetical protein RCCS2_06159 [Roseobacter sp. CCS2]
MIWKMTIKDYDANPPNHLKVSEECDAKPMIASAWKQVARFIQHVSVPGVLY